jgi:hypothetical protein
MLLKMLGITADDVFGAPHYFYKPKLASSDEPDYSRKVWVGHTKGQQIRSVLRRTPPSATEEATNSLCHYVNDDGRCGQHAHYLTRQ